MAKLKSINEVKVSGPVLNDARIFNYESGKKKAVFAIPVGGKKNEDGTLKPGVIINCESWHENSFDILTKGINVTVEGYIAPDTFLNKETQQNETRMVIKVTAVYKTETVEE